MPITFERGEKARALRDILAKHIEGAREPFAVATAMVKRGAKARKPRIKKQVAREFAEQKRAKKASLRKGDKLKQILRGR